ncbi:phytanoyl-CoA dioxygenase family protein [Brevibacillus fulvus]|uniref:Ectoine hydroxylase-related dioxygenase (Phytanoyl-CoA dioxygenase family) n=1 Tax=Brevibacillus fulvus TaxID=1125967 RepID=A0A938Y1W0_9BACL|nr:phytanoyl-CoA dioxygenase family protein [Brevibacillus fulvus]MBM7589645.1 ectoine hydroxylase-related dioxygenase (phytanoyl-CoA dioxygenase family) [Brevibacillus fulvus]
MSKSIGERERTFFAETGYLVIKEMFQPEEIAAIKNEYEKIWLQMLASGEIKQDPLRPLESLYPNRFRDFHRENERIARFSLDPRVIELLEELLEEEPLVIQTSYFFKPPGSRGLSLHQDNYTVGVHPGTTYAVWVSLDATDEENGGLLIVPGTHKLDLLSCEFVPGSSAAYAGEMTPIPPGFRRVQISTRPGDVVIFTGYTMHGSPRNRSENRYRQAFVTHFAKSSLEKITHNYSYLMNKKGQRVRKPINTSPKVVEISGTVFNYQNLSYHDQVFSKVKG